MTTTTKTVELSNGIRLPFLEQGHASGIPVVFLHGVTDSMHSFDPVLPYLPSSIHAFALTQRGHGDADRPAHGYRTRDFAGDVARFLDAVGVQMRSSWVTRWARRTRCALRSITRPGRPGWILAGAFASYSANAGLVEFWESSVSQLRDPIDAAFAREFQASTLASPIAPQFFELVMRECLKVPASVWRQAFEGFMEDDFSQELDAIEAPTLLYGVSATPRAATRPGNRAGRNRKRCACRVPSTGHAVHWEQATRFAADLVAFINVHCRRLEAAACRLGSDEHSVARVIEALNHAART
jgi:pimeloyl-ACP methyl ester carboxylesterase